MSRDEIRKRNFITSFPVRRRWRCSTTLATTTACMNQAQQLADVAASTRAAASEARGLKRGIGYSSYIEGRGLAPSNIASALGPGPGCSGGRRRGARAPHGQRAVFTGSHSYGQGA